MKIKKANALISEGSDLKIVEISIFMFGIAFIDFNGRIIRNPLTELKFTYPGKNPIIPVITTAKSIIFQGSLK